MYLSQRDNYGTDNFVADGTIRRGSVKEMTAPSGGKMTMFYLDCYYDYRNKTKEKRDMCAYGEKNRWLIERAEKAKSPVIAFGRKTMLPMANGTKRMCDLVSTILLPFELAEVVRDGEAARSYEKYMEVLAERREKSVARRMAAEERINYEYDTGDGENPVF